MHNTKKIIFGYLAAAALLALAPATVIAGNGDDGAKQEAQPMPAAGGGQAMPAAEGHNDAVSAARGGNEAMPAAEGRNDPMPAARGGNDEMPAAEGQMQAMSNADEGAKGHDGK